MKIFLNQTLTSAPTGGGNQFLRALCGVLSCRGFICRDPKEADVVLFDNYHQHEILLRLTGDLRGKLVVHRVAGLARWQNHPWDKRDGLTKVINRFFVDGTVFQTQWARSAWERDGLGSGLPATTVLNAPDPGIFFSLKDRGGMEAGKLRVIASSWSHNRKKGFDVYSWLDRHLDFSRYEMTFVGNSPVHFRNIRHVPPQPSAALAELYRQHDVVVTAVRHEPCSNALIEALHCGLPAVAFNDGGNPEIVGRAGRLFNTPQEIPALLEDVRQNYSLLRSCINLPRIGEVADRYLDFFSRVLNLPRRPKDLTRGLKALRSAAARSEAMARILYWKGKLWR